MRSPDLLDRIAPELPPFWLSPERGRDGEGPEAPALAFDPPAAPPEQAPQPFLEARDGEPIARTSTGAARDRPVESVRRQLWPLTLIGSITLHLLPFALLLLAWPIAPAEIAAPIPVQLVVEQPKPPPPAPPPPAPEKRPPPGRLASEDIGNPAAKQRQPGSAAEPSAPQQAPEKLVSAVPLATPSSLPLPEPLDQPRQPAMLPPLPLPDPDALPQQQAMLPPLPKPAVPHARRHEATPRLPAHLGVPGPAATRDEYLAYCDALIRRHFDLLPPTFIADRRGLTVLSLTVLDDGRIARIAVVKSSGYHDIDERVERMVAAVGRFPPLPQWYQGQEVSLEFEMPFPGGLARR